MILEIPIYIYFTQTIAMFVFFICVIFLLKNLNGFLLPILSLKLLS